MTQTTTLELKHGPIDVYEDGPVDGPPVVLVHGLLVDHRLWDAVVAPLTAAGLRVVRPVLPLGAHRTPMHPGADLTPPGLGKLLADVVDALGLEDATLVANDTGGAIAQIALTHPSSAPRLVPRVGRVVLTSCDAFENFLPPIFMPLIKFAAYVPGGAWITNRAFGTPALERVNVGLLAKTRVDPERVRAWAAGGRGPHGKEIRRDLRDVMRGIDKRHTLDAAARLADFDRPVLLAWSADDLVFGLDFAQRLLAVLPDARLEPIPGARTFSMIDRPEVLADAIRSFAAA